MLKQEKKILLEYRPVFSEKNFLLTNRGMETSPFLRLTLKSVLKYRNHSNVAAIKRISHRLPVFHFSCVYKNSVFKEIRNLNIMEH